VEGDWFLGGDDVEDACDFFLCCVDVECACEGGSWEAVFREREEHFWVEADFQAKVRADQVCEGATGLNEDVFLFFVFDHVCKEGAW
jgi:hypothetical protein